MLYLRPAARVRVAAALALIPLVFAGCDGGASPPDDAPAPASSEVAPPEAADLPRVDPDLAAAIARGETRDAIVLFDDRDARAAAVRGEILSGETDIVRLTRAYDRQKARLHAAVRTARRLRDYPHLPVAFVRIEDAATLSALDAHPDVARVLSDVALRRTGGTANLDLIRQPALTGTTLDGRGATVAVLDSGLDYTRKELGCTAPGTPATCKVAHVQDIAPDDKQLDDDGHGTNVAGIVVAVAPGARAIGLDVFDGEYAWTSALLAAIDWAIDNRTKYNIAAINFSLGGGIFTSTCGSTGLAEAMANARDAGIVPITAAGNDGQKNALSFPACAPAAVSVGAVYHADLGSVVTDVCTDEKTAADHIACFSNSASFLTILAPGVDISAAGLTMSGTSQAAPHVAGAIAILRARHPKESAAALIDRLVASGPRITDPRNKLSKPRLDLASLLRDELPSPAPAPTGDVRIDGGARATRALHVDLTLHPTRGEAVEICISNGSTCSAWRPFVAALPWTLPVGDGTKRVAVYWRDAAGRVSNPPSVAYVRLDTTAPSDGSVRRTDKDGAVTLKWTGFSDTGAGVAGYKLVSGMGAPPPPGCGAGAALWSGQATEVAFVPRGGDPSSIHHRVCAVDAAGNWSSGVIVR